MADRTIMRNADGTPASETALDEAALDAAPLPDEDAAALVNEAAAAAAAADLEAEAMLAEAEALAGAGALADDAEALDTAGSLEDAADAAEAADREAERLLAEAARLAGEEPPGEDPAHDVDETPTAEEQALAQADEEQDPEGDVAPADIEELEDELSGSMEKLAAKAKRLSEDQVRNAVHSLLFVADKPLGVDQLRAATGVEPARIRKSLERLAGELREGISGVILSEVAGGWQLRTAPESADYVRRFLQIKPRRLTRAALETL
ncbi:MAG TPA: SMC-Scp complex subunit ScpB, partial [Vulgatibacter sp.]